MQMSLKTITTPLKSLVYQAFEAEMLTCPRRLPTANG